LGIGLGGGLSLGTRAWDPGAGIALTTPPLRPAQFESLLPGQPAHGLLAWLVARHQQQDLQVHLRVNLADAAPTRLCTRRSPDAGLPPRLGLATWLRGPVQSPRFLLRLQGPDHGH
jgi:predicted component of type VI protein secretion system